MLEVYSFAAMFAAQILILSILLPARMTRQLRAEVARYAADIPRLHFVGGKLVFFRWLNTAIALLGLALVGGALAYLNGAGRNVCAAALAGSVGWHAVAHRTHRTAAGRHTDGHG